MTNKKVFVAMSGGVDSSVAAALLKQQNYEVVGVHMKCYNVDGCAEQDAEDARRAAGVLGVPFYVFDFEEAYKDKVVEYMVAGYRQGITPNPDVMCNKEIKFGLFLEKALSMGADYIATGHYVKLTSDGNNHRLAIAADKNKDQSYFLWTLIQDQLKRCLFPLGDYQKSEVRNIAKKFGLPNADKKDSQGVCFLGQVTLEDFLQDYIPAKQGAVIDAAGQKLGEHNGAHFYTIGQRHGLGIAGKQPYYVAEKNVKKNTVIVASGNEAPELFRKEVTIGDVNLINPVAFDSSRPLATRVRIRYRQPLVKAELFKLKVGSYKLVFAEPLKFIALGQSAVFYDAKGIMLGGGVIKSAS
ncbi:MAG: tRNA 2-thiouridine(34) synthase MnmA [bacterium]|nr:tRNA 2-thiouridine(34) synthase MnmA [bacterium]